MWKLSENLKPVNQDWHLFREMARRTAFSKEEFGESEQVEYDLDTADITGKDNPDTYTYDRPLNDGDEGGVPENGTDVRELDRH